MIKKLNDMELLDDAVIGTGACSKVVRCRVRNDPTIYALKVVDMTKISEADGENLRNEIALHKELNHPNIVHYYDSLGEGDFIYFLLEHCAKNTLYFFIHVRQGLPDVLALRFFYQVAQAVKFMHDRDIIHRDIKPENLLMDDDYNIKVCDLGWACKLTKERPFRKSLAGTWEYMSPEVVFEKGHGKGFDVWTLGILLYEMLHGTSPFSAESHIEMQRELEQRKITYSMKISKPVQDLLNGMLNPDLAKRLTIDQVLLHPAIVNNINEFRRPLTEEELAILENNNYLNQVSARRKVAKMINGVPVDQSKIPKQDDGPVKGTEAIPRAKDGAPIPEKKKGFASENVHQVFNPIRPADLEKLSQYTLNQDIKAVHQLSSNQQSAFDKRYSQNITTTGAKPPSYNNLPQSNYTSSQAQGVTTGYSNRPSSYNNAPQSNYTSSQTQSVTTSYSNQPPSSNNYPQSTNYPSGNTQSSNYSQSQGQSYSGSAQNYSNTQTNTTTTTTSMSNQSSQQPATHHKRISLMDVKNASDFMR